MNWKTCGQRFGIIGKRACVFRSRRSSCQNVAQPESDGLRGRRPRISSARLAECVSFSLEGDHPHRVPRRAVLLAGLYTGTRAGAICGAALDQPTIGRSWIDLENGIFYRQAVGKRKQKNKQQMSVRLPPRLLAHLRRWKRKGISIRSLIEWNGEPVKRINKAFRSVRREAGFGTDVVPHTLRHTCATWLAQRGVPTREAAGYLGMTEKTFIDVYGHHHPDHQKNAVMHSVHPDSFPTETMEPKANEGVKHLLNSPVNIELFKRAHSFGTRVSQVQILPLRPNKNKDLESRIRLFFRYRTRNRTRNAPSRAVLNTRLIR